MKGGNYVCFKHKRHVIQTLVLQIARFSPVDWCIGALCTTYGISRVVNAQIEPRSSWSLITTRSRFDYVPDVNIEHDLRRRLLQPEAP